MPNVNIAILVGNLTRDPEMRYTPSNVAVVDFSLAINRKYKSGSGEMVDDTCFIDCTFFGSAGELINEHVRKGDPLFVRGRLNLDQWDDKEGNRRSRIKVVGEEFQFLKPKGEPSDGGGRNTYANRAPASPVDDDDIPF